MFGCVYGVFVYVYVCVCVWCVCVCVCDVCVLINVSDLVRVSVLDGM